MKETTVSTDRTVRWHRFETRLGVTGVAGTDRGLARVTWEPVDEEAFVADLEERFPGAPVVPDPEGLEAVERQLLEYLMGDRKTFDLPVDLEGTSAFDRRVLRAASELGFGEVVPYGELARRIGRPRAARAVGGALGRNPVPVVVPCHRIVRSDGGLGGYGSGIEYKERLLRIEGREDLLRAG
jgi:methylated-DNA-[protein]-cysteine S-methyltransferase